MKSRTNQVLLAVVAMLLELSFAPRAEAATVYVTTTGTGGGTSWADATSLTNALRINVSGDAIWMAQGAYTNTATFTVASNNVAIYGGFTNGMATFAERNWTNYPAILDGKAQNLRVVTVTATNVTLDGLVISNSYGNAAGGIVKSTAGLLTLANCRITSHMRNSNPCGAGCYFSASASVLMTNCVVSDNHTLSTLNSSGYGVLADGVTTLHIVDCVFTGQSPLDANSFNSRDGNGGALYFNNGVLRVVRTDFINNRKGDQGGGGAVYIGNTATTTIFSNCVFRGNMVAGGSGGALYVGAGSSYTVNVVNCTFAANTNTSSGAAVRLASGTLNLKNCILWTNRLSSGTSGSEIYQTSGTLNASYNAITGGRVLPYVYITGGSTTYANNMTNDPLFASATDLHVQSPAGRWNGSSWVTTDTAYSPCIDAADPSDSVGLEPPENGNRRNLGAYGGTAQASKSPSAAPLVCNRPALTNNFTQMILRGELTNSTPVIATVGICYGTNNIVTDTTNGWQYVYQFYPPQQTGTVFAVTTLFLLTNTTYYYRAYATNAYGSSWGALESFTTVPTYPAGWGVGGGANVIHVKSGAVGEADGRDWFNAYPTLAAGIAAVSGSRTNIWITGATYSEGAVFTLANACTMIGGFAGTESAVAGRALTNALGVVTNYTVINGENSHAGVSITASGAVYLEALMCTNALYSSGNGGINKSGTGLLVMNNCQLVNNGKGGYISAGSVLMTNCLVANNRDPGSVTGQAGFGLRVTGASTILDLVDCLLTNNVPVNANASRDGWGAALDFEGSVVRVLRTSFLDNRGAEQGRGGAAVYVGGTAFFSNCVFRGNSVPGGQRAFGAAMTVWSGAATASVVNCTFAYNTNAANGGAIYVSSGTLNLKNSIFWTNGIYTGYSGSEIYATNAASLVNVSYSDFTGTNAPYVVATGGAAITWGSGLLTADPRFASATDVHLKSPAGRWNPVTSAWTNDSVTSPCIDAGTGAAGSEPEPNGGVINMGAYGGTWQASKTPQPPVITNGTLVETSMNEDAGPLNLASLGLAATDSSDVGWAWTNVTGSGPANGSVAVNGTGTNPTWTVFTYTPDPNFNGTNTFDVKVTAQNTLLSDTVTVRVVVNPLNDPPANTVPPGFVGTTYEAGSVWTVDNGTWNDNADTNAVYDGSGLSFSYQWYCSNSPSATAIENATNTTFTPGLEWLGSNLNVAVSCIDSGYPGAATTTVVTAWAKVLGAANSGPVILVDGSPAGSVTTNINEDAGAVDLSGLGLSATDDGVGGAGVTWTNTSAPANGTVAVSGTGTNPVAWTSSTYTPFTNFNGTNSFVVQAKDIPNATASITVTVVVAAINDPPANTVAPGYTGTRLVGNTLTATNGIWNDDADTNATYSAANFTSAASFTYQWWRSANAGGAPSNAIAGATAATYALTESDRFKYVSVAVTCTDGNYPAGSSSNTAYSAWLREATPPPIYVTTTGTGGGTSWADATSLTNALQIVPTSNMIWVAQGTYSDSATFTVATNGVTLYGGFTNGMASLVERDWRNYPTALNGQAADRRVVTVSGANVTLDGLVISNAYGNSAGGVSKSVAGLLTLANCRIVQNTAKIGVGLNLSGSVLMTNCVVAGNRAVGITISDQGFGLYASGVTLDIVDCVFSNNAPVDAWNSRDRQGGGIDFQSGTLRVLRTEFIGNRAAAQGAGGGAVYIGGSATFSNCVFRGNSANGYYSTPGAALSINCGSYTASIVNCTFAYNTNALNGGAIYQTSGTLNLKNCILWTNSIYTGGNGSEIYLGGGTMNVSYCDLTGSGSPYIFGSPTFANCMYNDPLFASATDLHEKSTAGRWDPGTQAFVTSDTAYSPCIDAGDSTDSIGAEPTDNGNVRINMGAYGGLAQASKSPPSVPPQLADRGYTVSYNRARISGELTNATYCSAAVYLCYGTNSVPGDTTNGWGGVLGLGDKQNGTVFAQWTPALLATTTYYYRWYAVNNDGGVWTPAASFVSGAAAPGGGAGVIHVNKGATGAGDGTSWPDAYTKIIDGLTAVNGSRSNVWITAQSYSEGTRLDFAKSATIVGGFAGTESAVAQRAGTNALGVVTNYTAINGENAHQGLSITAGDVWMEAITFSNTPCGMYTGGAFIKGGSGSLVANNCRFVNNRGNNSYGADGLGVFLTGGNVLLTNCVVADNQQNANTSYGFGIYSVGANLALVDCVVSNNAGDGNGTRGSAGAGLYFNNGTLQAGRTHFLSNAGGVDAAGGGAVYLGNNANTVASFTNCVFQGNRALNAQGFPNFGGAIHMALNSLSKTATVVNCTFSDNRNEGPGGPGGAIYVGAGTLVLKNSILWTNTVQDGLAGRELYATSANSRVSISYSDFTGTNAPYVVTAGGAAVEWGPGMLTTDPLYAGSTDLHLRSSGGRWDPVTETWVVDPPTSPCIDAGDPADPVGAESEPNRNRINMGAYGGTVQASRTGVPRGSVFKFR